MQENVTEVAVLTSPGRTRAPSVPALSTAAIEENLPVAVCDKLAFVRGQRIYLINPDASQQVGLARSPGELPPYAPSWSPDGAWIGYNVSEGEGQCWNTYILSVDGTDHRRLSRLCRHDYWTWSPDSRYLVVSRWSGLGSHHTVLDVETGESVCNYDPFGGAASFCDVVEMSDGKWWYFPRRAVLSEYGQRWAFDPTHEQFHIYSQHLSPNKQWVILWTKDIESEEKSLQIARSNGEELRLVTGFTESEWSPNIVWYKDSRRFAFVTYQDEHVYIWTARTDGEDASLLVKLPSDSTHFRLGWSASGQHLIWGRYVIDWPSGQTHIVAEALGDYFYWSPTADYFLVGPPYRSVWGTNMHEYLSLGDEFGRCGWSPNGHWLACSNEFAVAVFNLLDGERVKLPIAPDRIEHGDYWSLIWSSNSQWLAISATRRGGYKGVWIFDTSNYQTVLIDSRGSQSAWSPPCE